MACIVGAAATGIVAFGSSNKISIVFGTVSFLFILASLTFCLGFIQSFEQEVEATDTSLKWTSERFPKIRKEFALQEIASLIVYTLDNSATKIVITLVSGEVIQIPFSHFLCDEDEAKSLVQFLKSKQPDLSASVK